MHLVVFEDAGYRNLLPLVYVRATFDLRCGHDALLDKIEAAVGRPADALFVRPTIAAAVAERGPRPVNTHPSGEEQLWINGRLMLRQPLDMPLNSAAWRGDTLLAARLDEKTAAALRADVLQQPGQIAPILSACQPADIPAESAVLIEYPWDLVDENQAEIIRQAEAGRQEIIARPDPGAHLVNESAIGIGAGSRIKPGVVLDADDGPIVIGENVTVHANATVMGPCTIGHRCVIRPGAVIRGGTSLGPDSRVGGEIVCTIFQGRANKQHDGFLGHSYVGQWANLGADTVNSNLKNTYGPIKVPINGRLIDTGRTFVGAFIGDHVKTGIRTALPTGCVLGFASSIFVGGHAPKFVPSFCWLTDTGAQTNDPTRALAVARTVTGRRDAPFSETEAALFLSVKDDARRHETAG
jgi:UDP-N-acetylglucosamine diphosphorylase/glucosamine-1-phosphate N-acetyltransferase